MDVLQIQSGHGGGRGRAKVVARWGRGWHACGYGGGQRLFREDFTGSCVSPTSRSAGSYHARAAAPDLDPKEVVEEFGDEPAGYEGAAAAPGERASGGCLTDPVRAWRRVLQ